MACLRGRKAAVVSATGTERRPAAAGQRRGASSVRRPRWAAGEDELLRRWVAAEGTKWPSLVLAGALPGRTARGIEWRWTSLVAKGQSLERAGAAETGGEGDRRVTPCQVQETSAAAGAEEPGQAWAEAARHQGAKGSSMQSLRLNEFAGAIRGNDRRLGHGRAWTAALETSPVEGARCTAPREAEKMKAWGVSGRGPTRATLLPRAEQMLGRGKAAEAVHIGAQQKLPTLLASRAHVPMVSGCAARGTRLMHPKECARLMGISLKSAAWRTASGLMAEQALWEATADGLDAHAVRVLWRNAIEMAEAAGYEIGGRALRYAGMFAGALDTIFAGGRAARWAPSLRYVAVAEKCRRRLECVGSAYAVPMEGRFALASEMADRWSGQLDVMSVTPSCKKLSSAPRMLGGAVQAARRKREGRKQLLADVACARRVMERCKPTIVMIEETACLHSHHAELYAELQSELASWPYEWRHGLVDCADLGAAHHRRRVLWVGVRRADAAEC